MSDDDCAWARSSSFHPRGVSTPRAIVRYPVSTAGPSPIANADTIAAIATAPGSGGIGVLRISGARAGAMAETLLGRTPRVRHAHYCAFRDAAGALIDRGILLHFPQPNSFTGEDVVELQTHGSPVVLDLLLRRVCELGARPARAGEFSERAFLNGKLDLAQAEAIADLIASQSEAAARAALRSLDGEFSRRVAHLLKNLIDLRVYIEAAIDFPEEEIDFLAAPELRTRLDDVSDELGTVRRHAPRRTSRRRSACRHRRPPERGQIEPAQRARCARPRDRHTDR